MDPLLFLGNEFLRKMSDPALPEEEREAYRAEFSAYLQTEAGSSATVQLLLAFNKLDREDLQTFSRDTILWYLDWTSGLDPEQIREMDPELLAVIWSTFN